MHKITQIRKKQPEVGFFIYTKIMLIRHGFLKFKCILILFFLVSYVHVAETKDHKRASRARLILNEEVIRIPMTVKRPSGMQKFLLETTVYRPKGKGPFPLIVINHGSPRNAERRKGRARFKAQSREFIKQGFVVAIPMRRGYANSDGEFAESYGKCNNAHFYKAGMETAKDILAAIRFMQSQPYIDASRILLIGQSAGGFGSLALASQKVDGLLGVINFAGVRGSPKPFKNCSPDRLIKAVERYGQTTKVPSLWIYSENDSYISPSLAQEMHDAYTESGGKARFVMLPPFGKDGHFVFHRKSSIPLWIEIVDDFIKEIEILSPANEK